MSPFRHPVMLLLTQRLVLDCDLSKNLGDAAADRIAYGAEWNALAVG
jgi:hypothetical protein